MILCFWLLCISNMEIDSAIALLVALLRYETCTAVPIFNMEEIVGEWAFWLSALMSVVVVAH